MAIHKTPELVGEVLQCCPKHVDEQRKKGKIRKEINIFHLFVCFFVYLFVCFLFDQVINIHDILFVVHRRVKLFIVRIQSLEDCQSLFLSTPYNKVSIHPSIHMSIHPFVYLCIYPSIHSSIHPLQNQRMLSKHSLYFLVLRLSCTKGQDN